MKIPVVAELRESSPGLLSTTTAKAKSAVFDTETRILTVITRRDATLLILAEGIKEMRPVAQPAPKPVQPAKPTEAAKA